MLADEHKKRLEVLCVRCGCEYTKSSHLGTEVVCLGTEADIWNNAYE